jgi:dihydroorotate dehydrogenase (fumarate)
LATYLTWVQSIILADPTSSKPFIISITASSPSSLARMLDAIQTTRSTFTTAALRNRIFVELNTSCPNIEHSPPPSYNFLSLASTLTNLTEYFREDPTLTIGLKLPPYVYEAQFEQVVLGVSSLSFTTSTGATLNPIAFFTSTNTLGSSLLFADQTTASTTREFAVPTTLGGLAGDPIHPLSLGNVHTFTRLLAESTDDAVRRIVVIGVGGVTTPEAVARMRKAGAGIVGCATALGKEGVAVFEKLAIGLTHGQ